MKLTPEEMVIKKIIEYYFWSMLDEGASDDISQEINTAITKCQKQDVCPECGGRGWVTIMEQRGETSGMYNDTCPTCQGKKQDVCPECKGEGKRVVEEEGDKPVVMCDTCKGTGKKQDPKLRESLIALVKAYIPIFNSDNKAPELADQILALIGDVRKQVQQEAIEALNDYAESKISFERCAEIMNINYYELSEACLKRWQALKEGTQEFDG